MGDSILFPPTLSSSSMNITQGALPLASPRKKDSETYVKTMLFVADLLKYTD